MLFLFGFALFSLAWGQSCYFPDGSLSPNDQPCPRADGASEAPCCGTQVDGSRAICLSNNLCMSDLKVSRGSCTDQSWNAFACPHYCLESNNLHGGLGLQSCDGATLWSCDDCATSNFTMQKGLFSFSSAQLQALGVSGFAEQNATTGSTTSSTGTSTSAGTNPGTSTTAGISSNTPGSTTSTGTTPSLSSSPNTTSSPDNVTCSTGTQPGGANATVVGAAVGVSLGAALLTVAALLINERRKNIQLRHQLGPGPMRSQNQVPILSSPTSTMGTMGIDKPLPLYVQPYNKPPPPPPPPGYRHESSIAPGSSIHPGERYLPMQRNQMMGRNSNTRSGPALVNELDGSSPSEMASPVEDYR